MVLDMNHICHIIVCLSSSSQFSQTFDLTLFDQVLVSTIPFSHIAKVRLYLLPIKPPQEGKNLEKLAVSTYRRRAELRLSSSTFAVTVGGSL
jgi:hypothetical protein